jgi:hypothetical protein
MKTRTAKHIPLEFNHMNPALEQIVRCDLSLECGAYRHPKSVTDLRWWIH